tara:strand:+ start:564 stop:1064 length:501 start_codon:yes stop_codon:yes gene_type:complete
MAQDGVSIEINKQNLIDINLMFKQLPKQVDQNKVWVKFWRESTKPLVKAAQENAEALEGTGQLAKSVGFFTTKASRKYNGGYVGPKVKGAFKSKEKSGYYGAWVEYGGEVNFGGKGTGSNQTWMADAFNAKKNIVLENGMKDAEKIFDRALKIHERRLKKYGTLGY